MQNLKSMKKDELISLVLSQQTEIISLKEKVRLLDNPIARVAVKKANRVVLPAAVRGNNPERMVSPTCTEFGCTTKVPMTLEQAKDRKNVVCEEHRTN